MFFDVEIGNGTKNISELNISTEETDSCVSQQATRFSKTVSTHDSDSRETTVLVQTVSLCTIFRRGTETSGSDCDTYPQYPVLHCLACTEFRCALLLSVAVCVFEHSVRP